MKIAYCSDLHLGFQPFKEDLPDADILILAGDITDGHNFTEYYKKFFERVSNKYDRVLYTLGNHEHYGGAIELTECRVSSALCDLPNIDILSDNYVVVGDTLIFGSTLWTNLSNNLDAFYAKQGLNDYQYISHKGRSLDPYDTTNLHLTSLDRLESALKLSDKIIVVSHHAPCGFSSDPKFNGSILNAAFFTELSELILNNDNIKFWIHGHMHNESDYEIGNCRVLCNPRGYPGERNGVFSIKVFEC